MGIVELFTRNRMVYAVFLIKRNYLEIKIWHAKWVPPVGPIVPNVLRKLQKILFNYL
jgi:hypothetical protein